MTRSSLLSLLAIAVAVTVMVDEKVTIEIPQGESNGWHHATILTLTGPEARELYRALDEKFGRPYPRVSPSFPVMTPTGEIIRGKDGTIYKEIESYAD